MWVCLCLCLLSCTIGLPILVPIPCCFVTIALQYSLMSSIVIPPVSLFLFRAVLAIWGLLFFQMKFMIAFSISMRNVIGILIGIAMNLYSAFGRMAILTMLILPIQEHGKSFHLLRFSSISFFNVMFCSFHRRGLLPLC